jgi:sec-independent protein translocase protein TatB
MFGLGMGEIMVILVVALLVLGPSQLPDAAKKIGQAIRELRKHTQNLQETIEQDEHIGGTVRELKSALRGDEMPRPVRPAVPPPIAEGASQTVPQSPVAEVVKETPPAADAASGTAAASAPPEHAAAPAPPEPAAAPAPAPAPAAPPPEPTPETKHG